VSGEPPGRRFVNAGVSLNPRHNSIPLPFVRGWLRDPVGVGLPFPSSPWTARRLAGAVLESAIPGAGPVLELGAGTGSVTQALLALGCPAQRIVAVEQDAELCRSLEQALPGVHVLHGNALELGELARRAGIASVCAVLSGLPMRAIAPATAARYYTDAFKLMPKGGAIIQYTYGLKPPVDPNVTVPALDASFVAREWRNFPPMGIWRYRLAS
jgi:phosphatidylethanolamine/phosphatidyl-N-methylethanolamine N-methyltransferase